MYNVVDIGPSLVAKVSFLMTFVVFTCIYQKDGQRASTCLDRHKQTDRQTDRQTDKQTTRQR